MPDVLDLIQTSFAGGELAPSLWSRIDFSKYAVGLKTCRNFYVQLHGGASTRPGTKFVALTKDSTKKSRLIPFQFSTTQNYVLEVGHQYIRFYMNGGRIESPPGTPVEVATPFTENDIWSIKYTQSADVLYITCPGYTPKTLTRSSHTNWTLADFDFKKGPFAPVNLTTTTLTPSDVTGNITLTASAAYFATGHVGSLFRIGHFVSGTKLQGSLSGTGATGSIKVIGTWRLITHGTWTAKFDIERSTDNGATWQVLRSYSSAGDFNASVNGSESELCLLRINCTSFTSGPSYDLTCDGHQYDGVAKITGVTNATTASASVMVELGATTATSDWAEGAWSTVKGFPSCAAFHDERLVFANTVTEPQTPWFSRSGDYTNFGKSSPVVDDDAITAPLVSRQVNGIRSMVSLGVLLCLTSGGEWKIASSQGGLTPTNIDAKQQEYRGASRVDPVIIGNRVLYVQDMGATLRDIGYNLEEDVYKGDDLTVLARHLFKGYSVVDMAYQQEPDSIVWLIRNDGIRLGFTFLKEQDIWAWHRHDTQGKYESICSIPGTNRNEVWTIINRPGIGRCVELDADRNFTDVRDAFFVDCGLSLDAPITITGATAANPVVITAAAHGLSNGDPIDIDDIVWTPTYDTFNEPVYPDQLNGKRYKVAGATTDTFTLQTTEGAAVNGSGFAAYVSGGKVRKAVTTIAGLDHLNGKKVAILANGNVQAQQTVTGGQITLTAAASRVHVGLSYCCDLETLNVNYNLGDGTSAGQLKRIATVTVQFADTRNGYIGPNKAKLDPTNFRDYTVNFDQPIPLYTGSREIPIQGSYDTGGRVFIRQPEPLPMTVLAVIPSISHGG
jgi:hypothetical protein